MLPWGVKAVVVQPAAMRTLRGMSFAGGWLATYKAHSLYSQVAYGDVWAESRHVQLWENLETITADLAETVTALMNSLQLISQPTRMMTVKVDRFVFKQLSMLPDKLRDSVLFPISFGKDTFLHMISKQPQIK